MPKISPPISFADYQQLFRVIYTVLNHENKIDKKNAPNLSKACYFFNSIGARILRDHHGLDAFPVVGNAAYCLTRNPHSVLYFASYQDGKWDSEGDNAHCWIMANGWHIDLLAPMFPEISKNGGLPPCKARMMCKPLDESKESINDLVNPGDFLAAPNLERTQRDLEEIHKKNIFRDWVDICNMWYEKLPQKIDDSVKIEHGDEIALVNLERKIIDGKW